MIDVPCNKWSFNNRLLTFLSGTSDARGIDQWRQVGPWPKRGSKAFYILVPFTAKKVETDEDTGLETEKTALIGFRACPVFRYEDTDGKPLDVPQLEPPENPRPCWTSPFPGVSRSGICPTSAAGTGSTAPDAGR